MSSPSIATRALACRPPLPPGFGVVNDGYAIAAGFRVPNADRKATPAARRLLAKINHFLHQDKPLQAATLLDGERRRRTL